jgi:hypothetical protein
VAVASSCASSVDAVKNSKSGRHEICRFMAG